MIQPFISHWKDSITEFDTRNAFNNIWHLVNQKGPYSCQTKLLVSQKVIKRTKEVAILLILEDDFFILVYLFSFIFTVL